MNIYSQQDQESDSENEQSQISWSRIHKSSIELKSKKISKRQPQEIQKKWFSLRKISSCNQDLQEKKDLNLRDQKCYDFDYLQLDRDLLSDKNPILVLNTQNQALDKFTGRTLIIKVVSLQSEIIEVFIYYTRNYFNWIIKILLHQKIFILIQYNPIKLMISLRKQVSKYLLNQEIVNVSFSLLLFEYCSISLKQKCDELRIQQVKTIFLDLIQGLISARKANLQLKSLSIESILYSEEKGGFKMQDYTDATIGNNANNMKELGKCLIQIIKRQQIDHPLNTIAQEMINSEKPFEELLEMLEKIE